MQNTVFEELLELSPRLSLQQIFPHKQRATRQTINSFLLSHKITALFENVKPDLARSPREAARTRPSVKFFHLLIATHLSRCR